MVEGEDRVGKARAKEFWQSFTGDNLELMAERLLAAFRWAEDEGLRAAYCPRCKGQVKVPAPDPRAMNDALTTLHKLSGWVPKPEDVGGDSFVVSRSVVFQVASGEAE